jgi:processive 1,2-diacylglycerol beta-glucosyltransferase
MSHLRKKIIVLPDAPNIDELMAISTMIITKPGGITTAEALAKGLPMLIVHPLPGQEAMNTKYLLKEGVAVKAESPEDAVVLLEELLYNKYKLRRMSEKARALARPESALNIARLALHLIDR